MPIRVYDTGKRLDSVSVSVSLSASVNHISYHDSDYHFGSILLDYVKELFCLVLLVI